MHFSIALMSSSYSKVFGYHSINIHIIFSKIIKIFKVVPIIKWNIFSASLPQIKVNFTLEQNPNFSFEELLRRTFNSLKCPSSDSFFLHINLRKIFPSPTNFPHKKSTNLELFWKQGKAYISGEQYKIKIIIVMNKTFMLKTIL